MKVYFIFILLFISFLGFSEESPALKLDIFSTYPDRHDTTIALSVDSRGIVNNIYSIADNDRSKTQHMEVSRSEIDRVEGYTELSNFYKCNFSFDIYNDRIVLKKLSEDRNRHSTKKETINILIAPRDGIVFEDESRFLERREGDEYRLITKAYMDTPLVLYRNHMASDGWYNVDWEKDGCITTFNEYYAMDKPYEYFQQGGGTFIDYGLASKNQIINIVNFYIIGICVSDKLFLPFVFGIPTGSY
jgi:hypothetical protein